MFTRAKHILPTRNVVSRIRCIGGHAPAYGAISRRRPFGARLGLDEAYRFARGEEVMASSGQPARMGRPLDWLVIADHSDAMGFFSDLAAGDPDIIKFDQAKPWYEGLQQGGEDSVA